MGKAENHVEGHLMRRVEGNRGFVMKLSAQIKGGVPDRLVVLAGHTAFVETKAPRGRLSRRQKERIKEIRAAGGVVHVAYTREQVDEIIDGMLADPKTT